MKKLFRQITKEILAKTSSFIVLKNGIKFITIFGNYNQDVAVEGIYSILKDNSVNVCRNYVDFERDLDVSYFIISNKENFTILGFLSLMIKFPILIFSKKYKDRVIILNLSTFNAGVVKYYSQFIHSDIFLLLDVTKKALIYEDQIMKDSKKDAYVIIDGDSTSRKIITFDFSKRILSFGNNPNNDLIYNSGSSHIDITYNENHIEIQNNFKNVDPKILVASLLTTIAYGVNFHNAVSSLEKFYMPNRDFQKVFEKFVK